MDLARCPPCIRHGIQAIGDDLLINSVYQLSSLFQISSSLLAAMKLACALSISAIILALASALLHLYICVYRFFESPFLLLTIVLFL